MFFCVHLCDVVKVSKDTELFGLQFGLKMSSDDGNVVNHQLQAAGCQSYTHTDKVFRWTEALKAPHRLKKTPPL